MVSLPLTKQDKGFVLTDKMHKVLKPKLVQLAIECCIAFLIFLLGLNASLVESFYSTGLYPKIANCLRFVSGLFPFSIGDFLYVILIIYVLFSLYQLYKKYNAKHFTKIHIYSIALQLLNFTLLLYIIFKLIWGLNYQRPAIANQLHIGNQIYNTRELVNLGNYFLLKLNELKPKVIKLNNHPLYYDIDQLEKKATESFDVLAKTNPVFSYKNPSVKSCLNPWLVSKMGIEGYYAPLSGEANINMRLPAFVLPFTTCHEIAHQIGIAREDEANLIAYITASVSNDLNFKYAAYYTVFRSILFEIRIKSPEDYKTIYERIDIDVLNDFKAENEFWATYNGAMSSYMSSAFDGLLRLNNQKKGIKSYQDIVLWLYNYHRNELKD